MPPLPKLRIAALEELARQLRFAPADTLRRQLERAEQLAAEIDPAINYPEEWIVYRITGYRPQADGGAVIVGEALLADISGLVERLSAAARLSAADLDPGSYLDADSLCARWSISRKSLDRYRRRGLVAVRAIGTAGKPKLFFARASVDLFEERQGARLEGARAFARTSPELERRIIRRAATYRRRLGCTLNQASLRLAKRFGRGHETIRQLLHRHDAQSREPIFTDFGPPSRRDRELIERASFRCIEPGDIASRLRRSRASINRVITDQRGARLRSLIGPGPESREAALHILPELPRVSADCLAPEPVTRGLGAPGETDLLSFLARARSTPAPPVAQERTRAIAYHFLLARSASAIGGLPAHGSKPGEIDAIETDLRWATRLKAELMRAQLPLLIRTIEASLGRACEDIRAAELAPLLRDSLVALAAAVDDFHPQKGGRLAAPAGLAITRVVTRHQRALSTLPVKARATARLGGGVVIGDWTLHISPWQNHRGRRWLDPDPRVRVGMAALDERLRALLVERFGWSGPPRTHPQLAALLNTTLMKVGPLERRAVREAVRAAR